LQKAIFPLLPRPSAAAAPPAKCNDSQRTIVKCKKVQPMGGKARKAVEKAGEERAEKGGGDVTAE